jgi:two-component system chemotaxis response regulator CheB
LRVRRRREELLAELSQDPPENFCRPALDVLFRSLAHALGPDVLSVVLTGMGYDGLRGTEALKAVGVIARAGLADAVLPLAQIGPEIARLGMTLNSA